MFAFQGLVKLSLSKDFADLMPDFPLCSVQGDIYLGLVSSNHFLNNSASAFASCSNFIIYELRYFF